MCLPFGVDFKKTSCIAFTRCCVEYFDFKTKLESGITNDEEHL